MGRGLLAILGSVHMLYILIPGGLNWGKALLKEITLHGLFSFDYMDRLLRATFGMWQPSRAFAYHLAGRSHRVSSW